MSKSRYTEAQSLKYWEKFRDNLNRATPIDLNETPLEKKQRIDRLEKNNEEWFKYYFPNYYTAEAAAFQKKSTRLVMNNPELYLVRSWSRELAKSARTMMEVMKLVLTNKKHTVLLVSDSKENAERLLKPYKINFESNNRIINDYGKQQSIGDWEAHEFKTKKGKSFRAIGAGQSPRGTRNEAARPDVILIDDIDTDQDCRNSDIIKNRFEWIESALLPSRSISVPLLVIACGNIIAKYCCITEMAKKADKHEIVNIRDKDGNSSWPEKNTEEMIDRVLSTITFTAQQKEYWNNPIITGTTFTKVNYRKAPPLRLCEMVLVYADPSTSDKKGTNNQTGSRSYKSVQVIGFKNHNFYTYWIRLRQEDNKTFVDWLYQAHDFCKSQGVDTFTIWIENNSLQDPHFEQVIKPRIENKADEEARHRISVRKDKRKKPEKFERVEGTLQPLDQDERLHFDKSLEGTADMETMEAQVLSVSPNAKIIDGPDCWEGGVWIILNRKRARRNSKSYSTPKKRTSLKY